MDLFTVNAQVHVHRYLTLMNSTLFKIEILRLFLNGFKSTLLLLFNLSHVSSTLLFIIVCVWRLLTMLFAFSILAKKTLLFLLLLILPNSSPEMPRRLSNILQSRGTPKRRSASTESISCVHSKRPKTASVSRLGTTVQSSSDLWRE